MNFLRLNPPWCVGSVFGAVQSSSDYGPLHFNPVLQPDEWLDTECRLHLFNKAFVHPKRQMDYLNNEVSIPYCGSLVHNIAKEDLVTNLALVHDSNYVFGNRLQTWECDDGKLQVVFPVGDNFNCIGSIFCEPDASGRWHPVKKEENERDPKWLKGVRMALSHPLAHPIQQISASGTSGDQSVLLARTPYKLHAFKVHRKDDRVSFDSHIVKTHRKGIAHMTWNPHLEGEFVAASETGEMLIYDLNSAKRFSGNIQATFEINVGRRETAFRTQGTGLMSSLQAQLNQLQKTWWRCEFGWHPRTLIVANTDDISFHDVRESRHQVEILSSVRELGNYCHAVPQDRRFSALVRSDYDTYQFATSTYQHILLYDVRRPKTPVLQWEHKMQKDAPGFLSIFPLSALRPGKEYGASSAAGRVIMASSFRSGEIRCFNYGPRKTSTIIAGPSTRFQDMEEEYCAWEFPSTLSTSDLRGDSWFDVYKTTSTNLMTKNGAYNVLEGLDCLESLCGLAVVGDKTKKEGFNLVQLTGSGKILSQSYIASKEGRQSREEKITDPPHGLIEKMPETLIRVKLFSTLNYVLYGVVSNQEYDPPAQMFKKRKQDFESQKEKYRGLIYQALKEIDISVSNYELAVKVLFASLPEELAEQGSAMPSNVSGLLQTSGRLPYVQPPRVFLRLEETSIPLTLPYLLEKVNEVQATTDDRHSYFNLVCELVEEVRCELKKKQEQAVTSLNDDDNLDKSLLFHTVPSRSIGEPSSKARASSSRPDTRYQSFTALRSTPGASNELLGLPVAELKFKTEEIHRPSQPQELSELAKLQQDFAKWEQSYAPYTEYCNKNKMFE